VGTSKKRLPDDSQRVRQRYIAQGTNVSHDGPAKVPGRLDAGRRKGATVVQMARVRPVVAPVTRKSKRVASYAKKGGIGNTAMQRLRNRCTLKLLWGALPGALDTKVLGIAARGVVRSPERSLIR
jgi:hypothetical protein